MIISVSILDREHLNEKLYTFCFNDTKRELRFTSYLKRKRPTRRHGFKAVEVWRRNDQRQNNIKTPEVPTRVQREALSNFMSSITFDLSKTKA